MKKIRLKLNKPLICLALAATIATFVWGFGWFAYTNFKLYDSIESITYQNLLISLMSGLAFMLSAIAFGLKPSIQPADPLDVEYVGQRLKDEAAPMLAKLEGVQATFDSAINTRLTPLENEVKDLKIAFKMRPDTPSTQKAPRKPRQTQSSGTSNQPELPGSSTPKQRAPRKPRQRVSTPPAQQETQERSETNEPQPN